VSDDEDVARLSRRSGGCAHCSAGDSSTDGMWLVLLVLLRRRWRRTRSGVPQA
jgi:hypothetical protein